MSFFYLEYVTSEKREQLYLRRIMPSQDKGQMRSHLCLSESGFQCGPGTLGVIILLKPLLDSLHPGQGFLQTFPELMLLVLGHRFKADLMQKSGHIL